MSEDIKLKSISTPLPMKCLSQNRCFCSFLIFLFLIVCLYLCVGICTWVWVPVEARGVQFPWCWSYSYEFPSNPVWVLGTPVLWNIKVFNHSALSPVPERILLKGKPLLMVRHQAVLRLSAADS